MASRVINFNMLELRVKLMFLVSLLPELSLCCFAFYGHEDFSMIILIFKVFSRRVFLEFVISESKGCT